MTSELLPGSQILSLCKGMIPRWILGLYFLAHVEPSTLVRPGGGPSLLLVISTSPLRLGLRADAASTLCVPMEVPV